MTFDTVASRYSSLPLGFLKAEQWLSLDPSAMVARNIMVVRKLGLPVARLTEVITRVPD